MTSRPRVLYHALGGGLGHATRALALARQMANVLGGAHHLHINTPFTIPFRLALRSEPGLSLHAFSPDASADDLSLGTLTFIREWRPDLLVVDNFPRGVVGELVRVHETWSGCPRVLISRGLPPQYVERYALADFVRRHYDLILAPGEPSPFAGLPGFATMPPFLVRDRDELLPREEALRILGADRPVVLVVGSGTDVECQEWERIAVALAAGWPADAPPLRLALPPCLETRRAEGALWAVRHFPLVECLRGVRLLIGNAGYNLVHEARAAGVAGLFAVRGRRYDDQAARLRAEERAGDDLLTAALCRLRQPPPAPTNEPNGALLAARRISRLLEAGRELHHESHE
jgi:hypothetical protein